MEFDNTRKTCMTSLLSKLKEKRKDGMSKIENTHRKREHFFNAYQTWHIKYSLKAIKRKENIITFNQNNLAPATAACFY